MRAGQREALHRIGDGSVLGALRLHEFEPGGSCGEKIADLDHRAGPRRRRAYRAFLAARDRDVMAAPGASRTGYDVERAGRAERGQRLAAKAESAHVLEIAFRELRGGVPLHAKGKIAGVHATAIVGDTQQRQTAVLRDDLDGGGAGVDGVFDEFLHRAGRALDHLARGDLVDLDLAELADRHCQPSRYFRVSLLPSSTAG